MNSEIHLINDDDISSFDIGTPAFLDSSWSTSTGESLHSTKQDVQDFVIFIEPTISTFPIDPDTRQRLSDEIEKLFVESHYLSITSELVTPQLLRWERKKKKEKENAEQILEVCAPSQAELKQNKPRQKLVESKKQLNHNTSIKEEKKVRTKKKVKLIPVRLKSGEEVKATQDLILHFRQKLTGSASSRDIDVFKIQSHTLPQGIQLPFTDHLSPALKRLSGPKFYASSPAKQLNGFHLPKNGKRPAPLKLRAALDKSTIAWSSTTKTRPKASLLDQLKAIAKELEPKKHNLSEIPPEIPSVYKDTTPQKPLPVVPVVIKLKKKANSSKLLPLSQALKLIASDTLNLDTRMKNRVTNGEFSTPT